VGGERDLRARSARRSDERLSRVSSALGKRRKRGRKGGESLREGRSRGGFRLDDSLQSFDPEAILLCIASHELSRGERGELGKNFGKKSEAIFLDSFLEIVL
jgi:hypothetical protein